MKHELSVTIILIAVFILSQLTGLFLVKESLQDVTCEAYEDADCVATYDDTIVGERPETTGMGSILYIIIGVSIGTAALLLLARYGKTKIWKAWFFFAVWLATSIALGVVLPAWLAWVLALLLASWKLWKPNVIIYNIAEVLMYAGIAVLLVPVLEVFWVIILLVLISVYDAIAVWKSKHMVTMAKFITSSNSFAGLVVPYNTKKKKVRMRMHQARGQASLKKKTTHKNAILGGGDITFPLLFAGVVMQARTISLVAQGVPFASASLAGFLVSLLVALGATLAIAGLFLFAKKDRFYPAMPFVSAGCLFGWALTFLV